MEQTPFNPETHCKDYKDTEAELSEVKESITGEKSSVELAELVAKRDALTADLEAQKAKAYDQADEDNENLADASEQIEKLKKEIEGYKYQIGEITGVTEGEREEEREARREALAFPSLVEVIARCKAAGYLDTSFEGKETHPLTIRPLTEKQAFDEYYNSGGKTFISEELGVDMEYAVPEAEQHNVMILNFGKDIGRDEALAEIDKLGARPLTGEELIQYGIIHPSHQEQKLLVGLGTDYTVYDHDLLDDDTHVPFLGVSVLGANGGVRFLEAHDGGSGFHGEYRFPVVCK